MIADSNDLCDRSGSIKPAWHALAAGEVLERLTVLQQQGLTSEEAKKRQETCGMNQLVEEARPTFLKMLFAQFNNFIVILLIVAATVSALLGEWVDAGAIIAIVVLNSVLGVIQESRAEEALAALKKLSAPEAQVLRNGKRTSVPASELVPGDIVYLEAGNFVPADMRLLEAANLRLEEAALTGESVPVEKSAVDRLESDIPLGDRKNTAFMGTTVSYGRGSGVVVSTGMNTQLGLIASMLQQVKDEETPLQQRLDKLGRTLGWAALAVCAVVFAVGLARSDMSLEAITAMFMVAVSLAIAAVPEGLPAVVTISLANGMREMVRRHALIRRLASVETLGSATVICTDKTGTLTQNQMTVTRLCVDGRSFEVTGKGTSPIGEFLLEGKPIQIRDHPGLGTALWVGTLNNDALLEEITHEDGVAGLRIIGDPTEGSILVAAVKSGTRPEDLNKIYPRTDEIPFDSTRKRMVTVHAVETEDPTPLSPNGIRESKPRYAIAVKGAPDVVLDLCRYYSTIDDQVKHLDDAIRKEILAANDRMTGEALRVLGLAYRLSSRLPSGKSSEELEEGLVFVGMVGMIDPPRSEVTPALEKARRAGIRTIMITGDYPNTAGAIARSINLLIPGRKVLTGSQLNRLEDSELREEISSTDVFARVSPEHKMRIVDALRDKGEVVAMTGDGVNDAPAIKRADIGISMGITGTDVAKQTADMVLTDDNYASIVAAIEQGRIIYSNIRKFVFYLLSCNSAEIMIIFLATLFTGISPLAPIQLLLLNLVTDGAPALALSTEKGDPNIMDEPPRPPSEPIVNRYTLRGILVQTIAITTATLGAYWIGSTSASHAGLATTMTFATLSVGELLRAFTARSEYVPIHRIGIFNNKWMNLAVLGSLVIILLVIYVPVFQIIFQTAPLGWDQWLTILPLMLIPAIGAELTKVLSPSRRKA